MRLHQPESVRRLATAGQVADLILQCAVLGEGGEVFGLDPERAVRTSELAELLILLSGNRPGEDIRLDIIGGLPTVGEPNSAITTPSERILPTAHPRIWLNFSPPVPAGHVQRTLYSLFARLHELDADELRRVLLDLVAGYRPTPVIRGNSGDSSSKSPRSGRGQDWQRPELS